MSDFWEDAANSPVAEPPTPTFESLPDKANVIVRTTTREDKETVQPKIREIAVKNGPNAGSSFFTLKMPVVVIGGDAKITAKHVGKGYLFPEFNIEAPSAEQLEERIAKAEAQGFESTVNRLKGQLASLDKFPCAPELYNALLDCLSPEGATTQERWGNATVKLATAAKVAGLTLEACKGNKQYLVAAAFHALLMEQSYTVIGATYTPKKREGSQYDPQQTVGSIGAYTEAEAKRRKVRLIEAETKDSF